MATDHIEVSALTPTRAKIDRLCAIGITNQYFPSPTLSLQNTKNIKARVSLPYIAQLRQNSCVEELHNADPGLESSQDMGTESLSLENTLAYNPYDLEYLSDLTELSSDDSDCSIEEGEETQKDNTQKGKRKKASSVGDKRSNKRVIMPPKIALQKSRASNNTIGTFKPRLGSSLTGKERKAARKQQLAAYKRKQKAAACTDVMQANNFNVEVDPRHTTTRWSGVNAKKDFRAQIRREIEEGRSKSILSELSKVPYLGHVRTCITDDFGRLFIYRSSLSPFMLNELLPAVNQAAEDFVKAVKHPFGEKDRQQNARGLHWFSIAGHDRNSKEIPSLSVWHRENLAVVEEYFRAGSTFHTLTKYGCRILSDNFPAIARRYEASAKYMKSAYNIEPMFGLFWNWCLNAPREGVKRVFCLPHVDHKNIALGVCMVFVYGHFNHREKCWLVIWEAGVVMELPPGVFLLYPSSLFIHFNIDLCDLPIVVTANGERPTPENSEPLFCTCSTHDGNDKWHNAEGRGSIVWFNQATMFQTSELGVSTVAKAKEMGMDARCDTERWLRKEPVFPRT